MQDGEPGGEAAEDTVFDSVEGSQEVRGHGLAARFTHRQETQLLWRKVKVGVFGLKSLRIASSAR